MASSSGELRRDDKLSGEECVLHKTKTISFFGRSAPIVLQNDNGPCPLLAICNVLLLKNQLTLSPDISEVSQEKLLSLVAERLIDANSNVTNKDEGYVENQQKNIADVLDLLPQLTTGIDVNIKFRRIDDFEFTPQCAIFDLLNIPLYHGWMVDPQDKETTKAIGSKSYNTLMGDLVALETRRMEDAVKDKMDEDSIDFVAATTATLGVPSPSLLRTKSFDESPRSTSNQSTLRKGDAEEEAELLMAMKLSENELANGDDSCVTAAPGGDTVMISDENLHSMKYAPENPIHMSGLHNCSRSLDVEPSVSGSDDVPGSESSSEKQANVAVGDAGERQSDQLLPVCPGEGSSSNNLAAVDAPVYSESTPPLSPAKDTVHDQGVECPSTPVTDSIDGSHKRNGELNSTSNTNGAHSVSASDRVPSIEAIESFTSTIDRSEPIYEGEECIMDSEPSVCENREPVYEGEAVLAEQADKGTTNISDASQKVEITDREGELISNFLKNNASQLTFYGLFCLQEGLKECEVCVFFRNNHFSTMFKFEGELYLLATDQGYMNQPDLVWEKLNEVNGDTLFMTGNFKEFKLESSTNATWDEQNVLASTADYLASIDNSSPAGSNMNSDLQLAIALQQQEFEQQPQRNVPQQPPSGGSSRLITGPQVPRSNVRATPPTQRQEQKPKDKSSNCKIM